MFFTKIGSGIFSTPLLILYPLLPDSPCHIKLVNLLKPRIRILKKHLIGFTEIIPVGVLSRHRLPVSPAAIAAQAEPAAFLAVFLLPHGPLDKAKPVPFFIHLLKAVFLDIAQSPLIQSIKITGINASICLKHPLFAADAPHIAALRLLSRHDHHEIFKITVIHISSRPHVQIPGIEHALQKFPVFLRFPIYYKYVIRKGNGPLFQVNHLKSQSFFILIPAKGDP